MADRVELVISFTTPLKLEMIPTPSPVGWWEITSVIDRCAITTTGDHMSYTLPDDKHVNVKVTYKDAKGHDAKVDGEVTWSSSDEGIASVGVMQTDSTQAQITPGANLGQAQITASADADLGEGVTEVLCTMDVDVVAGSAVIGVIEPISTEPVPTPQARRK